MLLHNWHKGLLSARLLITGEFQLRVRFFGKIQIRISESKNAFCGNFFGQTTDHESIQSKSGFSRFTIGVSFWERWGFEKCIFDKQYTTDAVHV